MAADGENGERVVAGRYRLGARLGRGGMGTVWRAEDQLLGRAVAVKELHLDEGLSTLAARTLRSRTLREARTVAQVVHPHILVVHDVVEEGERPWIVMELVTGRSLADRIAHDGPLAPAEAARIGLALTGALRAAHERGVLHRDLKPGNVLLESGTGRVVLTDFGIAQMPGMTTISETGAFVGSPEYTAPERMEGKPSDGASDLWSLGVLLCAAVEGETPFWRDNLAGVLHAVAMAEIRIPDSTGPLRPVVEGLLRRDPAERTGADEADRLLRAYVETGTVPRADPREVCGRGRGAPAGAAASPGARAGAGAADRAAASVPAASAPAATPAVATDAHSPGRGAVTTNNRATMHDADTSADPSPPSPEKPTRRLRRGRMRTLATVVVAAVVGGSVAVGVLLATGAGAGDEAGGTPGPSGSHVPGPAGSPGADGSPEAAGTPEADASSDASEASGTDDEPSGGGAGANDSLPPAPEGYRTVRDPAGFQLAVPQGFTRSYEPPRVYYYSPGKTFRIGIHIQGQKPGGAAGEMREAHEEGPQRYPGYRDGSVRSRSYEGSPGALWQFAWDGGPQDDGSRYTYDQSWDSGGRMYDIWVSAPESRKATGKRHFDTALRNFVLVPSG